MVELKEFPGYYATKSGKIYSAKTNRYLRPATTKLGYLQLGLSHNNKGYSRLAHRLIAETYVPNPDNKKEVNHIDGDKTNNWDWNLEWATRAENMRHAFNKGLISQKGINNNRTKLNMWQIRIIKAILQLPRVTRPNQDVIGRMFGVQRGAISKINTGLHWNLEEHHG